MKESFNFFSQQNLDASSTSYCLREQCTVGHLSMAVLVFKEIESDTIYEQRPSMNTCCQYELRILFASSRLLCSYYITGVHTRLLSFTM